MKSFFNKYLVKHFKNCIKYLKYIFGRNNNFFFLFVSLFSYICLHYHGRLYISRSTIRKFAENKTPAMGTYYVRGVDKWKKSGGLGFMDFFVYNILLLLVVPQSSSIAVKACVIFGCIVSVQVGLLLTHWLKYLVNIYVVPGVPLPVIMVSVYIFLLRIIMPNFNQCIEL